MECMQAKALKPSLRGELTQQDFVEEFYCATTTATAAGISCVAGEDFSVDDLLNLQNVDFEDGFLEEDEDEEEDEEEKDSLSLEDENSNVSGEFSVAGNSDSPLASQLAVPDDDIAELEWVSHFVDDSLSDFSLLHPLGNKKTEPEPRRTGKTPLCFPSIPVRPRTKRPRSTTRPSSLSQFTESSTSSSSSPSLGFSSTSPLIFALLETVGEPERKKQKRKPAFQACSGSAAGAQFQRRCSHCLVQKTPQWRAGPLGAKTLCNACGVRFKSGRLFPEYRPACSPTFCSDMHSNSHRKVLEMRKKKEIVGPGSGLTHAISSF